MSKNSIRITVLTVIVAFLSTSVFAEECEQCKRKIPLLSKCDNLHVEANRDDKLKEWNDCIDELFPEPTLEDSPELQAALAQCAHLAPRDPKELMDAASLGTSLYPLVTSPCFHVAAEPTDYFFEASFEAGLGGVEEFQQYEKTKKLESILTISLYYDGDEKTLIKTWQTKSAINSASAHYNKMFKVSTAVMRQDLPIEKLLWDFERTPTICQIRPEKDMVEEAEEIDIKLTDFMARSGGVSQPFNRIFVMVNWGEILNGVHPVQNPKVAVYKVGSGSITVKYRAPKATPLGSDQITVFNSCDIFKEAKMSLSETSPHNQIAMREIPIARPGVTAQVTRKSGHTSDYTKTEGNTVSTHKWTESSEITVSITFAKNPRVDISFDPATMKMKPRRFVYYVEDYSIISSNHSGSGSSEETVGSGQHIKRHVSRSGSQNGTFQDLKPRNKKARLTITVDPATGKATEIGIPSFDAVISIMSQIDCHGEKRVDGRMEPFDCSSSGQFTQDFPISSHRDKCLEISGGDGVQVIRGQCSEHKTTSQGSKEESYEWVIYKRD